MCNKTRRRHSFWRTLLYGLGVQVVVTVTSRSIGVCDLSATADLAEIRNSAYQCQVALHLLVTVSRLHDSIYCDYYTLIEISASL